MKKTTTKTRRKKTGTPGVEEKMKIKVLSDAGHNKQEIMKMTGRGYKAVTSALKSFDLILVADDELYDKFESERDRYIERMVQNSAALIVAADQQTANELHNATAIEAAKISEVHAKRLDAIKNIAKKGMGDGDENTSPKIVNFINQVFNIAKDDRPKTIPETKQAVEGDAKRGAKAGDAGTV